MVQHTNINSTGDIKAELVRRGGRLPERLTVREREWFTCKKLTFTDWRSLVNGQLSPMHWRVPNRGKLISYSARAMYVLQLPNFIESSPPSSLRGQPMYALVQSMYEIKSLGRKYQIT